MKHFQILLLSVAAFLILLLSLTAHASQVCFSPDGECDAKLVAFMHTAQKSLVVAIYDINRPAVVAEIIDKAAVLPGNVRVVVDEVQSKTPRSQVAKLVAAGVKVRYGNQPGGIMHDKFTIVDGAAVETGSFNYTNHATGFNQENQVYLTDAETVAPYVERFEKMWAGGKPVPVPTAFYPHVRDIVRDREQYEKPAPPVPYVDTYTLHEKQVLFSQLAAQLLEHAREMGYEVTLGEAWRSQAMASYKPQPTKWYADHGKGVANSLHVQRLALDVNLFKDGKLLEKSEEYRPLGEWWETQHPLARWGGRFKHLPDGNHFSLEHEGVK